MSFGVLEQHVVNSWCLLFSPFLEEAFFHFMYIIFAMQPSQNCFSEWWDFCCGNRLWAGIYREGTVLLGRLQHRVPSSQIKTYADFEALAELFPLLGCLRFDLLCSLFHFPVVCSNFSFILCRDLYYFLFQSLIVLLCFYLRTNLPACDACNDYATYLYD